MAYTNQQKNTLMGTAAALMVGVFVLQYGIDPLRMQVAIQPPAVGKTVGELTVKGNPVTLPFEYTLGALTGFRQVIAGLLWVRTDEFFHSGNYDAILPMIRLITWLDPNWLDVYATGAWHLMYNFTDTDQRSDRRYLGPGMALLNEGIANNSNVYDLYKEKGWNAFDKIKDYDLSVETLQSGVKADPNYDVTQVGHLLAHSLERAGRTDEAVKQWQSVIDEHERRIKDPKTSPEDKGRNESGLNSSRKNWEHLQIRKMVRAENAKPPIDVQFTCKVTRLKSKVLKIEGTWRCWGASGKSFDMGTLAKPGKGVLLAGPADGARVDVRLQDEGYKQPTQSAFSFDIDQTITIMQDQISTRDGKLAEKGGLFVAAGKFSSTAERAGQNTNVYQFTDAEVKTYGLGNVTLSKGLSQLSPWGKKQAVSVAYPLPYNSPEPFYSDAEATAKFAQLVKDTAKLAELDKKHYSVAQASAEKPGEYSRQFDMSKDPTMYSFSRPKYELILSLNPRVFPDNIQDRFGYSGEGLTDKNYLVTDPTRHDLRMIRRVIEIDKADLVGTGEKVLVEK